MNPEGLLTMLADRIEAVEHSGIRRCGIDGVDGAGKTTLADRLGDVLSDRGFTVIRASVDGFHNPKEIRYRRGRDSPEGFYRDSYDYARMKVNLLDPLSPGGSRLFRCAFYDHATETPLDAELEHADESSILIVDGIFLHRPELRDYWDFSVFLVVDFEVSIPRSASRGFGSPDPQAESNSRYVEGQQLYLAECEPERRATIAVDYNDLDSPGVLT